MVALAVLPLTNTAFANDPFGKTESPKILIEEPTDIAFDQVNWKQPKGSLPGLPWPEAMTPPGLPTAVLVG